MILLPAALASGLSLDQLQTIVTHELAHIRRFDLLVNLLQRFVEAMLFFHPAVWYVSRRINIERENATDDMVLSAGFGPVHYADALVRMAELSYALRHRQPVGQGAALAAAGTNGSEFKRRVLRLVGGEQQPKLRLTRWGLSLFLLAAIAAVSSPFMVQAWAEQDEQPRRQPETKLEKPFQVKIQAVDEATGDPIPNPSLACNSAKKSISTTAMRAGNIWQRSPPMYHAIVISRSVPRATRRCGPFGEMARSNQGMIFRKSSRFPWQRQSP